MLRRNIQKHVLTFLFLEKLLARANTWGALGEAGGLPCGGLGGLVEVGLPVAALGEEEAEQVGGGLGVGEGGVGVI